MASVPGFVPGYDHDVFVSYAHVDDLPQSGAERGWVTTLVSNLRVQLARKLGRDEARIWMDHQLAGNTPVTPTLIGALERVATLLVVMSPGYLASEWCMREASTFHEMLRRRRNGDTVFVVHRDELPREAMPQDLRDLTGYRFWERDLTRRAARTLGDPVPQPGERAYYDRLADLAFDLSGTLKRMKDAATDAASPAPAHGGPAVFLAEVTEDLEDLRDEVRRYLAQAGLRVLPERYYPRDDPDAFEREMRADLAGCRLFVQLLSQVSGRKAPGRESSYACIQCAAAMNSGVARLQWRARDVDPSAVGDAPYRRLLEADTVQVCGVEEFKARVAELALRPPANAGASPPGGALVFVDTDAPDMEFAQGIGDWLSARGVAVSWPITRGHPAEIRADLEENLRICDGLVVVYGATSVAWVRRQLLQGRKAASQRNEPLVAVAVCEAPPPGTKDDLALRLPHMRRIDCSAGFDEAALSEFLRSLEARTA